jgi:hypothetical protein
MILQGGQSDWEFYSANIEHTFQTMEDTIKEIPVSTGQNRIEILNRIKQSSTQADSDVLLLLMKCF